MRDVFKLCAVCEYVYMKQKAYLRRGHAASRLALEGVGQPGYRRRSRLSPSLGRGRARDACARSGRRLPIAPSGCRCRDRRALLGVADGVPGAAPCRGVCRLTLAGHATALAEVIALCQGQLGGDGCALAPLWEGERRAEYEARA